MSSLSNLTISVVSHKHGKMLDNLLSDLDRLGALDVSCLVITLNVPDPFFSIEKWSSRNIKWIINESPKGFGANHNQALSNARTDWALILNPDIRLPDAKLVGFISSYSHLSNVGVIAPRIISSSGVLQDSVRSLPFPTTLIYRFIKRFLSYKTDSINSIEVHADWFAGMFLLLPTRVFSTICGFDERYFLYCEDCDFCLRISLLGRRLLLDERYVVIHDAQRSSHKNIKFFMLHFSSLISLWISRAWWLYIFYKVKGKINGIEKITKNY